MPRNTSEIWKQNVVIGRRNYWKRKWPSLEARFWSHVDRSGQNDCWSWKAFRNPTGYGMFGFRRRAVLAHRMSWAIKHNIDVFSIGETCVLHKCDNPPCCNPEHLFLGTRVDNAADMKAKGRVVNQHGEDSPNSKITEQIVRKIRSDYAILRSYKKLEKIYGLSDSQIQNIILRRSWKHIK